MTFDKNRGTLEVMVGLQHKILRLRTKGYTGTVGQFVRVTLIPPVGTIMNWVAKLEFRYLGLSTPFGSKPCNTPQEAIDDAFRKLYRYARELQNTIARLDRE